MTIVKKNPVPVYSTECQECHSVIEYKACEVSITQSIICPVCGKSVWAPTFDPVKFLGEDEKPIPKNNKDYLNSLSLEYLAKWFVSQEYCPPDCECMEGDECSAETRESSWIWYLELRPDDPLASKTKEFVECHKVTVCPLEGS